MDEFCDGFLKLMDHLELDRVSSSLLFWRKMEGEEGERERERERERESRFILPDKYVLVYVSG